MQNRDIMSYLLVSAPYAYYGINLIFTTKQLLGT